MFSSLILPALAKDTDFNGRWDITVEHESRSRAWWLEVSGAGTPQIKGRFVGAPGGNMDEIPEIAVDKGQLRFVFNRNYLHQSSGTARGIYTARIDKGLLVGTFEVEGQAQSKTNWTGKRAPVIKDRDDGSWKEATPISLFDGKDMNGWSPMVPGQPIGWQVKDGVLVNVPHANNLVSTQKFWNFKVHIEFRIEAGSNSGIGLRGRYEVQILDDYGKPPDLYGTGALYSRILPRVNAAKPAGEWQTYDVTLIGRTVTVIVNGTNVIDKGEIEGLTAIANDPDEAAPWHLTLQGDHGAVEIRKVTVSPLRR
jgi:hypothetical protein